MSSLPLISGCSGHGQTATRYRLVAPVAVIGFTLAAVVAGQGAAGPGTTDGGCVAPVQGVPAGWLWIPTKAVDSAPGAYHDKVSGAFVSYDGLAETSPLRLRSGRFQISGRLGGIPYQTELIPNIRQQLIERGRRLWGSEYPAGTTAADTMPLADARRLNVTFASRSVEWHFTADLYGDAQEKRVRELLLGRAAGICDQVRPPEVSTTALDTQVFAALEPGTPAEQLLHIEGLLPYVAFPRERTGFRLFYGGEDGNVQLHFDRNQTLVATAPR